MRKGTRLPPTPRDTKSVVPSTLVPSLGIDACPPGWDPDRREPGQGHVAPVRVAAQEEMDAAAANPHQTVRRMADGDAHLGVRDLLEGLVHRLLA